MLRHFPLCQRPLKMHPIQRVPILVFVFTVSGSFMSLSDAKPKLPTGRIAQNGSGEVCGKVGGGGGGVEKEIERERTELNAQSSKWIRD